MINRILLVVLSSLFLAACGGGGGGGGGSTPTTDSGSGDSGSNSSGDEGETPQEEQEFSQQQNSRLPLIQGAGWSFANGTVDMTANLENKTFDGISDPVYSLSSEVVGLGTLKQYFVSLPDKAYLAGLGGPIAIPVAQGLDYTVNSVEFSKPIQFLGSSLTNETLDANLEGTFLGINFPTTLSADVSVTNDPSTIDMIIDGQPESFESTLVNITIAISGTVSEQNIDVTITEQSELVQGVGFVERDINVAGIGSLNLALNNLINLAVPIKYTVSQGNPVQPANITLRTPTDTFDATEYDLLDESLPSWLEINEQSSSNTILADVINDGLPTETTTKVVYLGANGEDAQIPVNVTVEVPAE